MRKSTEIERLVAGSYSALRPSESVEDAVRDALPAERLAPRRLPRTSVLVSAAAVLLIGVALAFAFAWSGRGSGVPGTGFGLADGGGQLALPVVARPHTGVVPRGNDEITVQVHGGHVFVLSDENTWEQVSLDGFAAYLGGKAGKDGFVVLRADRNTPWQHLQWLMTVCAEVKRSKVALAVRPLEGREFLLDATLPVDPGLGARPTQEIKVQVTVRVAGGSVRYAFGDRESIELASVARWIAGAKKAVASTPSALRLVGEIKAAHTTPWEHVARLLGEFRQGGIDPVQFFGTALPTPAQRAARTLPAPEGDWNGSRRASWLTGPGEEELVEEEPIVDSRPAMIFDADTGDVATIERAAAIVRKRLRAAGFAKLLVTRDGRVLRVESPKDARRAEVRKLVEQRDAALELHLTVEPGAPNYESYWLRLKDALACGVKFKEARDVKPADRARDDIAHERYPLGLRWYRLAENASYGPGRLPAARERYVLCRKDAFGITHESLRDVVAAPSGLDGHWLVKFRVKPDHQENMARLTRYEPDTYLAIIVNDEVRAAPVLRATLSDSGQISGSYTEVEAKTLAAMLTSEPLPVKFTLAAVESGR